MRHAIVILVLLAGLAAAANTAHAAATMAGDLPRRAALGFASEAADGAIKVVRVDKGSAAAVAGLRVDDQISAIDGVSVASALDGRDRLRRTLGNASLRLGIVRQGARLGYLVFGAAAAARRHGGDGQFL